MRKLVMIVAVALAIATTAGAAVRPAGIFSDASVLQRGVPMPVWGYADDGEKVTVKMQGQSVSTIAKDGKWMVTLAPLKAGGPYKMTVSGNSTIEFQNMLVGDVWVCSGQSNMQFPLCNATKGLDDMRAAENPMLRLYTVPMETSYAPYEDTHASWQLCTPASVERFSAVGYYFGRDLQKKLNVPVGLINSSWGGTIAEAWTSPQGLNTLPDFKQWMADEFAAKGDGPNHACVLFNAMINPLVKFPIKGAIWYQGESNAGQAFQYRKLFPTMIKSWRDAWGQPNLPFLFVQLAPFQEIRNEPQESAWAELREAQMLTMKSFPKTAMAVITDVGDPKDIHPRQKEPVGSRLALAARAIAYGEKIVYSGPLYKSMKIDGSSITLTFDFVGGGLVAKDGELKGFAIAGADKKFVFADAKIVGDKIVVSSPSVDKPVAVRYGWADCPVVNLYNKEGLPASPFRTDDFPMVTAPKK